MKCGDCDYFVDFKENPGGFCRILSGLTNSESEVNCGINIWKKKKENVYDKNKNTTITNK
jgi:hypothetical protein